MIEQLTTHALASPYTEFTFEIDTSMDTAYTLYVQNQRGATSIPLRWNDIKALRAILDGLLATNEAHE